MPVDDDWLAARGRRLLLVLGATGGLVALVLWCLWKADSNLAAQQKAHRPAPTPLSSFSSVAASSPATASPLSSATPAHPPGLNGADLYKRAYELFGALTEAEKNLLAHPRDEVDADKAAALFAKIQPIMDLVRQAKKAPYVDWAIGPLSYDTPLPHLTVVLKLGQMARWDAAYLFPTDPGSALADLSAQTSLSRSVGDQAMIGFLVEIAGMNGMIEMLQNNAGAITPDNFADALQMLNAKDVADDFTRALTTEQRYPRSMAAALADPRTRAKTLDAMARMPDMADKKPAELEAETQDALAQSEWLAQVEQTFAEKARLPTAEFDQWWAQIEADAESRPFVAGSLPVIKGVLTRYRADSVKRTMLSAGLTVMQSGADQLSTYPDPTTGQPFLYLRTVTGFELRSPFQDKKSPSSWLSPLPLRKETLR